MQVLAGAPQVGTVLPVVQHGTDRLDARDPSASSRHLSKAMAILSAVFDH